MAAGSSGVRLGKAFIELGLDQSLLMKGLSGLKNTLNNIGGFAVRTGAAMAGFGAAITTPLAKIFDDAAQRSRSIGDLATQFGTTAENISALASGFEHAGVSFSEFGGILSDLQGKFFANNDLLRQMGLETRVLARQSPDVALGHIADAFSRMTDSAQKASVAQELFGASWPRIIQYLEQGSAGIQKIKDMGKGGIIDQATIDRANASLAGLNDVWLSMKYILLDVGSALLPTAEEMKNFVEITSNIAGQVREWIDQNKEAVQITFLVGAALTVAGVALGTFGAAVATAGFAVGGLVILIKGLAAIVAAVFSPAGLLIAGIAGIGVGLGYLAKDTETFKSGVAGVKEVFSGMADTAKASWGGISDAMKKGDLAGAANIAFLGLSAEWRKMVLRLTIGWNDFKGFFLDGWRDLVAALSLVWNDFAAFVWTTIGPVIARMLKGIAVVVRQVDSEKGALISSLADSMSGENVENIRRSNEKEITDKRAAKQVESDRARAESERKAREELASTSSEFAAALAAAHEEVKKKEAASPTAPARLPSPDQMLALADKAKGSFQTSRAAQQFGIGDSITTRLLDGINNNTKVAADASKGLATSMETVATALRSR